MTFLGPLFIILVAGGIYGLGVFATAAAFRRSSKPTQEEETGADIHPALIVGVYEDKLPRGGM